MNAYSPQEIESLKQRTANLEAELEKSKIELQNAKRHKTDFLANMTHELRTPLNAVIGFSRRLQNESLTPDQHQKISYIHDSARGLLELISDLVTLAQIEQGRLEVHPVRFNLESLAQDVIDFSSGTASYKGLELELDISKEIPQVLIGDRARLRQALICLFDNAVKFTSEGKVRLRVSVQEESENQLIARFDVEDTGPGIPESLHEMIFDLFTQGDGSINRSHEGTGAGLSLIAQIAKISGGEVGLKSKLGKGSVFTLLLPYEKKPKKDSLPSGESGGSKTSCSTKISSQPGADETRTVECDSENNTESGLRFLIVDDDRLCRELMKDILSPHGGCDVAVDGNDAIQIIEEAFDSGRKYDLICLDIMMPGMDGHTTLKALRNLEESLGIHGSDGISVIMTTALNNSKHVMRAFRGGCEAYVTKPVDEDALFREIGKLGVMEVEASTA